MPLPLTPELYWLTLTCLMTGLFWVPYILQLILQLGPVRAIWDPTGAHPHDADWALRAKRAHYNAVENLVVFAPLVLVVTLTGTGTPLTATAAAAYLVLRLAHYLIHTAALPVLRTVVFLGGWACQMVLGLTVLGLL
ncbi:MAG TPA: MAPEG family protein [Tabrizicola sp.]|nr:MAPEG family protein [Tabrizicola sp.]